MTTATMTAQSGSWGKAVWFPVAAIFIGLAGGYAMGRALRVPPPPKQARYVYGEHVADEAPPSTKGANEAPQPAAVEKPPAPEPSKPAPSNEVPKPAEAAVAVAAEKPPAAKPAEAPGPAGAKAKAHIKSNPDGAQVARATDGELLGTTPFDLELPESDQPLALLFWKKGYTAREQKIVPRGELSVTVDLAAASASSKPKKRRGISASTTIDPFK